VDRKSIGWRYSADQCHAQPTIRKPPRSGGKLIESEEKARERERDSRRQEGLQAARAMMMEILEGAPEFTDLAVVDDWSL
jgi:hypothetical protein